MPYEGPTRKKEVCQKSDLKKWSSKSRERCSMWSSRNPPRARRSSRRSQICRGSSGVKPRRTTAIACDRQINMPRPRWPTRTCMLSMKKSPQKNIGSLTVWQSPIITKERICFLNRPGSSGGTPADPQGTPGLISIPPDLLNTSFCVC